ncbi:hypothetical protein [Yoonia sp.]|uniref:hypothetical protein n=1 Tax=Yoonia sp. TaxID=2212373 RepID=UPI0035C8364D
MDTPLNLTNPTAVTVAPAPVTNQAITRKVTPVDAHNTQITRPAEKPFAAQVVSALLSDADFPQAPGEIAPAERTLRPYDVPMLPYAGAEMLPASDENTEDAMAPGRQNVTDTA